MIGLPYGEKKNNDDMLSRFHLVPERNGQTYLLCQYENLYSPHNIARHYADAR